MTRLKTFIVVLTLVPVLGAWFGSAGKSMPKTVSVVADATHVIPVDFTAIVPGYSTRLTSNGASTQSLVLQELNGRGYSHLMVLNNTGSSIALVLSPYDSPRIVPGNTGSSVLWQLPNTNQAWDDIPVFDEIYIRSNKGTQITSGNIDIMVW